MQTEIVKYKGKEFEISTKFKNFLLKQGVYRRYMNNAVTIGRSDILLLNFDCNFSLDDTAEGRDFWGALSEQFETDDAFIGRIMGTMMERYKIRINN
jgi:hypothetical protein